MNGFTTYLMVALLVGAAATWLFTLIAGLVLTVQAYLRDSLSIATAAGIHVILAILTKSLQVIYLPAAVVVLLLAGIAGIRLLLRFERLTWQLGREARAKTREHQHFSKRRENSASRRSRS